MDELSPDRLLALAEAGDRHAQYELGRRLWHGDDGPPDVGAARLWLTKAAEAGHVLAQYELARLLRHELAEYAPRESTNWCSAAASVGLRDAQFMLGVHLSEGFGCEQDPEAAVLWWQRAAAQGEPTAMFNLWVAYGQGKGVPKNVPYARRHLRRALLADPRVFKLIRWKWHPVVHVAGWLLLLTMIAAIAQRIWWP